MGEKDTNQAGQTRRLRVLAIHRALLKNDVAPGEIIIQEDWNALLDLAIGLSPVSATKHAALMESLGLIQRYRVGNMRGIKILDPHNPAPGRPAAARGILLNT